MIVNGRLVVESYFSARIGHAAIRAARRQFDAWLAEALKADWKSPAAVKAKYASASIVAGNRVVFNISGNRFRLIVAVNYRFGVIDIRFFGTHAEYDEIDVETV
jgi:mRNA interferase HigB